MNKIMIDYPTFLKLYTEAHEYETLDMYIGERGWQEDWMDTPSDISDTERTASIVWILSTVYDLSKNCDSVLKLRNKLKFSTKKEMANKYNLSYSTYEKWEYGNIAITQHTFCMMVYTVFIRLWIDNGNKNDTEK